MLLGELVELGLVVEQLAQRAFGVLGGQRLGAAKAPVAEAGGQVQRPTTRRQVVDLVQVVGADELVAALRGGPAADVVLDDALALQQLVERREAVVADRDVEVGAAQAQNAPTTAIDFSPCQIEDAGPLSVLPAECGTLEVAENPAAPAGARSSCTSRVFRRSPPQGRRSLLILAGGPGMAASTMYAGTASAFARIQRNRDIVLLDQRGTGRSNALECAFDDEKPMRSTCETEGETARCLAELSKHADVAYYTTSVAVRDLDHVRGASAISASISTAPLMERESGTLSAAVSGSRCAVILDGVIAPATPVNSADRRLDAESALLRCAEALCRRCGVRRTLRQLLRYDQFTGNSLQARPVPVDFIDRRRARESPRLRSAALRDGAAASTYTVRAGRNSAAMLNLARSGISPRSRASSC